MAGKINRVVWTRQARESLNDIIDYRYRDVLSPRKIVRNDIIGSSKEIVFSKQYQRDDIFP